VEVVVGVEAAGEGIATILDFSALFQDGTELLVVEMEMVRQPNVHPLMT
jgi:hypothetical protein